jgi:hypothetical protein
MSQGEKKPCVYLCGPINGCTDAECVDWRQFAISKLRVNYLDPMVRDYRGREREPGLDKIIVKTDKEDIDNSTMLMVNYVKPSVGTSMEILYAWERSKVILIVCKKDEKLSPWITYHSHMIVHSMETAIAWIHRFYEMDWIPPASPKIGVINKS